MRNLNSLPHVPARRSNGRITWVAIFAPPKHTKYGATQPRTFVLSGLGARRRKGV